MRLHGQQFQQFRDALLKAFSLARFDNMLLFQYDITRSHITTAPNQEEIVLDVIKDFNYQNRIEDLLLAARKSNARSPELLAFAQQLGRGTAVPPQAQDGPQLERTIRDTNSMLDVVSWRTRLATLENQVCRVEVPASLPPEYGTGFLLAPDVIITNYHVVEKVHKGQVSAKKVTVRFDYALLADGITPNPGTVYPLVDDDWLIDFSKYSALDTQIDTGDTEPQSDELDYALLRIAGGPGNAPVGGTSNKDPEAPSRKWIELPSEPYTFVPKSPLFILQHPDGAPLKLALENDAVIGINTNGTRVRYRTNTEGGSSGSPCFDANWNLVALHHAGDPNYNQFHKPTYNQGVPIAAILNLLSARNKRQEIGQ